MHHLVGQGECSLPGCVKMNMVHPHRRQEMGYCCEDHRLRATQRSLVSEKAAGGPGLEVVVFVFVCFVCAYAKGRPKQPNQAAA